MDELVELTPAEAGVVYIDVSRLFVDVDIGVSATQGQADDIRRMIEASLAQAARGEGPAVCTHESGIRIAFYQAR